MMGLQKLEPILASCKSSKWYSTWHSAWLDQLVGRVNHLLYQQPWPKPKCWLSIFINTSSSHKLKQTTLPDSTDQPFTKLPYWSLCKVKFAVFPPLFHKCDSTIISTHHGCRRLCLYITWQGWLYFVNKQTQLTQNQGPLIIQQSPWGRHDLLVSAGQTWLSCHDRNPWISHCQSWSPLAQSTGTSWFNWWPISTDHIKHIPQPRQWCWIGYHLLLMQPTTHPSHVILHYHMQSLEWCLCICWPHIKCLHKCTWSIEH